MNFELENKKLRKAHQEAAEWLILLDSDASDKAIRAFNEWRNSDPLHDEAFLDATKAWSGSGALHKLTEIHPERVPAEFRKIVQSAGGWRVRWKFLRPAATVGFALTSVLFAYLWLSAQQPSSIAGIYKTAVGEQATITLRDGSEIILNTDSEMRVAFTNSEREIELSHGEALFNVKSSPTWPFVVTAGQGKVRAIGTTFSVFVRPSDTEVTVVNGVVEVSNAPAIKNSDAMPDSRTVHAQQRIVYNKNLGNIVPLNPVQLKRSISWREGVLDFDGWPLEKVVAEINRYQEEKIEIKDERLKSLKVGGVFKVTQPESLLKVLAMDYNIQSQRAGPKLVVLYGE